MREKYIKRTYRISKDHDTLIKKYAKKSKISESEAIRTSIGMLKDYLEKHYGY